MKHSNRLICTLAMTATLALAACGKNNGSDPNALTPNDYSSQANPAVPVNTGLTISQFSPAAGTYSSIPTSIQVSFSAQMDQYTVTNRANWTMVCNGATVNPNSVYLTGNVATLSFSSFGFLNNNTACTLTASNSLSDVSGNRLSGTVTATYVVNASAQPPGATTGPVTTYNPTFQSVVAIGPVGGRGGDAQYPEFARPGYTLKGLSLYYQNIAQQIAPIWAPNAQSGGGSPYIGNFYGNASGTFKQLTCPNAGDSHVVGIHGKYGALIDRLGLICQAQDGSSSARTKTATYGGNGGGDFELACPAGKFVMGIQVRKGTAVDQIILYCQ